jgi:cytochrome c oxidase assembly protein subunit 15
MNPISNDHSNRQVANWLLIGVVMIVIQILLGGITRLTESGLSITEWKPITGTLPPLNEAEWQTEFDKYKTTDQFKYVHQDFSISDFKFIFFWEWLHRVWARLMGLVFLAGFVYFLAKKQLKKEMTLPMIMLFILGGLQGAMGWIMVQSGLVPEKYYVGHVELTTHFIMALLLLAYTLWFALKLRISRNYLHRSSSWQNFLILICIVMFFQLIYGGFMAGLRTAAYAPTWPDINGYFIPPAVGTLPGLINDMVNNQFTIHLIHRSLAYLLFILILVGWWKSRKITGNILVRKSWLIALILILFQVLLGVLTVLNSPYADRMVWLGVSHQFVGMLLVMVFTFMVFLSRPSART